MLEAIAATPWQPRGEARLTDIPKDPPPLIPKPEGACITSDRQLRYGQTPNCPGCQASFGEIKPHSSERKKRFTDLIQKENEPKKQENLEILPEGLPQGIAREPPPPEVVQDSKRPRLDNTT